MSEEELVEAIFQRDLKIKKLNEKIKKDYVSKDKIKEKIKELELRKSFSDDFTEDYYLDQIDILQELLGE